MSQSETAPGDEQPQIILNPEKQILKSNLWTTEQYSWAGIHRLIFGLLVLKNKTKLFNTVFYLNDTKILLHSLRQILFSAHKLSVQKSTLFKNTV